MSDALKALPEAARGLDGNVVFDEFEYHPDPEDVWDAAAPARLLGKKKMRILSTPNGAARR